MTWREAEIKVGQMSQMKDKCRNYIVFACLFWLVVHGNLFRIESAIRIRKNDEPVGLVLFFIIWNVVFKQDLFSATGATSEAKVFCLSHIAAKGNCDTQSIRTACAWKPFLHLFRSVWESDAGEIAPKRMGLSFHHFCDPRSDIILLDLMGCHWNKMENTLIIK